MRYNATTNLNEAVSGADYVVTMFRCGTLEHQRIEQEIPRKYGVDQVVADTLGPGGVFRGLRTLKALFEVVDAMEKHCPGAYLLNYVNPMSINTIAMQRRAKTVKVIGLCHSVQHTIDQLSKYIEIEKSRITYHAAGVNHQAFFLKFDVDGKDGYPLLRGAMAKTAVYNKDKVRFEWFKHFGYFPTESSGHGSEYTPYIRKRKDLVDKLFRVDYPDIWDGVPHGNMKAGTSAAALECCEKMQISAERHIKSIIDGTTPIKLDKSDEYAIQIINSIESNTPIMFSQNQGNHPNPR